MKYIVSCVFATALTLAAHSDFALAQQARGDSVVDGLKFHPVGGSIQVVDVAKSQVAGTIILPPNHPPMIAAMPGYDARLKAAYEKYSHSDAGDAAQPGETAKTAPDTVPLNPASQGFDAASKTVTLSGERSVTFVDNENLKVQMPGPAGTKTYELHFHGASAGSFIKSWAGREQSRIGGSLGGGGVTISLEGQKGMPGGEVYETAKGTVYGNSGFTQAKSITAAVREAADVVKTAQPDLAKLKVVKSLLSNNLGM
jgi:hypothetical protein